MENTKRGSWSWLRRLKTKDFRRLTGVKQRTFKQMVGCLEQREADKAKTGRELELSLEDQLLLTLQYLREYPTLYRLGIDWGVHETTAGRVVKRVEEALIKYGFRLPGKRKLRAEGEGWGYEVIVVDVAESSMERPQKNSGPTTAARRNATP
ncbi:MAG: transposase family protein [Meiothermus sp.]|nr:transposase family protein [Meiothermus sp.]